MDPLSSLSLNIINFAPSFLTLITDGRQNQQNWNEKKEEYLNNGFIYRNRGKTKAGK